jgi:hypothetical protein
MIERTPIHSQMMAVQLCTDEGAYLCNIRESDMPTIEAAKRGTFVVVHCAIRLDAMSQGLYELHETKVIETSSIDFYRSLHGKPGQLVRRGPLTLCARKGRKNG